MTKTPDRHHRIDYLEFAVTSIADSRRFFGDAFGWTFQDYGPDYCQFRDGRLTGGFVHGQPQPGGTLVVLYSEDLASTLAAVQQAGGAVVKPVFEFPGGRRFHFCDPDGYTWAAWSQR